MEDEEGEVEEVIPKVKKGDRYEMVHKENGQKRETKILSRARKAMSRRWKDSYNIRLEFGTNKLDQLEGL